MNHLDIQTLSLGSLETNCYLVMDTKTDDAIVIDPADEGSHIAEVLDRMHANVQAIIATHGHFDHILGGFELEHIFSVPMYVHPKDYFLVKRMKETAEHFLGHSVIEPAPAVTPIGSGKHAFGSIDTDIWEIPGHTPGSIAVVLTQKKAVFDGDVLFADGSVGRTDSSYSDKKSLADSIKKIMALPEETELYPGHGESILLQSLSV